jgi:hypothetical protein
MARASRRRSVIAGLVAVAVAFASAPLPAQTPPAQTAPPNPNRTVNVNYVYAADLGFGGYSLAGLTADVYTLPLTTELPGTFNGTWKLRLMAPIQGGIYRFRATDTDGQRIAIDQQTLSIAPGAELLIPVADRLVVKPFAQVGVIHGFGGGVGNPDAWEYIAGVRSVAAWQSGAYTLSLGSGLVFAGDHLFGPGFSEHYTAVQFGGEIRRPLGFQIGNFAPDVGLYAADYYYPSPLVFTRFLKPPLRIANQNEIGISLGSAKPMQILSLSNPRIGAGFAFGGGLDVWHVSFGFPF